MLRGTPMFLSLANKALSSYCHVRCAGQKTVVASVFYRTAWNSTAKACENSHFLEKRKQPPLFLRTTIMDLRPAASGTGAGTDNPSSPNRPPMAHGRTVSVSAGGACGGPAGAVAGNRDNANGPTSGSSSPVVNSPPVAQEDGPSPPTAALAEPALGGGAAAEAAVGVAVGASGRGAVGGNYLVSETEDNLDDAAGAASGNSNNTGGDGAANMMAAAAASAAARADNENENNAGSSPPTAIPQEDDQDDEQADNEADGEEEEEDESDYEYEYEDDDEGHYSGFIVETSHPSVIPPAVSAAASADGGSRNGDADEDGQGAAAAAASEQAAAAASSSSTAAAAASSSGSLLAPISLAPPRKSKWREPSQKAVNMSLRAENEKTGGKRRLASDLYKIMMNDTEEAGYDIEPKSEDSMDAWTIKLFGFDKDSNLYKDMLILGLEHIELEMRFPEQYPFEPPFVRVVRPRFKRQTGFVMNGALCMELLTTDGWNPVNDIESVIVSIRSLLVVGDGRLEAAAKLPAEQRKTLLAEAEAKAKLDEKKQSGKKGDDSDDDDDDENDDASRKRPREGGDKADADSSSKKAKAGGDDSGTSKKPAFSKAAAGSYSTSEAKSAYQHLSDYHKKKGWDQSGWWARKG